MFKASQKTVYSIVLVTERESLRDLVQALAPGCVELVDWDADTDAKFARSVDHVVRTSKEAGTDDLIAVLREIERFGDHAGQRAMRSVIAVDKGLLPTFEEREDPRAAAIWVFLEHPQIYQLAIAALESDDALSKATWGGFELGEELRDLSVVEPDGEAREKLLNKVKSLVKETSARSRMDMLWFERRADVGDGEQPSVVVQMTVFVELSPEAGMEFDESAQVRRKVSRNVAVATVLFDQTTGEMDVVVKGGMAAQDEVAAAFLGASLGEDVPYDRVERRPVDLSVLKPDRPLTLVSSDPVQAATLKRVLLAPKTEDGARIEVFCRQREAVGDVYDIVDAHLTQDNLLRSENWRVLRAEIRFVFRPDKPGGREPKATVRLTAPNKHDLHELPDTQKEAIVELLERWGVLRRIEEVFE